MTTFFVDLFKANGMEHVAYAEPYAGGAGAAVNLLLTDAVDRILINDANIGVYSFWHYLITEPERFIERVQEIPVTLEQWHIEKDIASNADAPSFELGVATFFLSRTNRSGVINAGPIGGNSSEKQNSASYKIDCRFNKPELLDRLRLIAEKRDCVAVSNLDALDFLRSLDRETFVYLDPPYYVKGKCLYMNHYTHEEHQRLADFLLTEAPFRWVLSYDDVAPIRRMYETRDLYRFPLSYTVQDTKKGMELLTHSSNIVLPKVLEIRRSHSNNISLIKICNPDIMSEVKIERFGADELHFDSQNPRLIEFSRTENESELLNILWSNMAVNELVLSILANGFFHNEAMYAVRENGKVVIVEGNRRLAAVKAILDPDSIRNGGMNKYRERISKELVNELKNDLPVIMLNSREEAWRYIGFKHVNGAAKWDSYAKAEYIAQVHNNYNVPLEEIATQIGDSNQTTLKLYQGLMVLNQADKETDFKKADVYYKRIYFSHVYTAIMYTSMQEYLGLDMANFSDSPVPKDKLPRLEEVMIWLLGSKKQNLAPVVKSQNPGIRQLCEVIKDKDAVQYLRVHNDLDMAFDWSLDALDVFHEALVSAQSSIHKALSKVSYYDGSSDLLRTAMAMANDADQLFNTMKEKRQRDESRSNQRTLD